MRKYKVDNSSVVVRPEIEANVCNKRHPPGFCDQEACVISTTHVFFFFFKAYITLPELGDVHGHELHGDDVEDPLQAVDDVGDDDGAFLRRRFVLVVH